MATYYTLTEGYIKTFYAKISIIKPPNLKFQTLFESGMRKGECAALRLDAIIWRENILRVVQTLEFQPEDDDELLGDRKNYVSTCEIKMREKYTLSLKTYIKYRTESKMLVGELYNHELNLYSLVMMAPRFLNLRYGMYLFENIYKN